MKTVLVTGSSGLVGSACVDLFRSKGWDVVGVDNNMRAKLFGLPQKDILEFDIRDENLVNDLFQDGRFDAIIHTAAQPSHDWAKREPLTDFDINARGTLILLEATRKYCPDAVFVHVSTDKVYGENMSVHPDDMEEKETRWHSNKPFNEDLGLDFAGQRSLFGCSKTSADIYVQEYGNYFGIKTACFRPGCITGRAHAGAEEHGFLAYLVKCVREDIPYKILGYKGKQVRDQIHAKDIASAFWHFIQDPKVAEVYNMGGGPDRSVSVLEALLMAEKTLKKKATTEYVNEARKGDRVWDVHDISKFRSHYPSWDYEYDLQDIINDLCDV